MFHIHRWKYSRHERFRKCRCNVIEIYDDTTQNYYIADDFEISYYKSPEYSGIVLILLDYLRNKK